MIFFQHAAATSGRLHLVKSSLTPAQSCLYHAYMYIIFTRFFHDFHFFRMFPVFSTRLQQVATCTWSSSSWLTPARINILFLRFVFSDFFTTRLKVRLSRNEFMKSSIFQNSNWKIWRISALKGYIDYIGTYVCHCASILCINSFWLNLTFRHEQ